MINPRFEVDRLRQTLIFKGLEDRDANHISELAAQDISVAITELVVGALSQAAEMGSELGIDDFSSQIRAVQVGSTFQILTDSGRTDWSVGDFQMLPHLLKNAKRAKDGTLYKVIPMRNKNSSKQVTSIFESQRNQQEAQKIAADHIKTGAGTNVDPLSGPAMFSGLAAAKDFIARKNQIQKMQEANNKAGPKEFRTATSKQSASESWVIPAKERDMTQVLVDLNRQLETDIQTTVQSIVRQYEEIV